MSGFTLAKPFRSACAAGQVRVGVSTALRRMGGPFVVCLGGPVALRLRPAVFHGVLQLTRRLMLSPPLGWRGGLAV